MTFHPIEYYQNQNLQVSLSHRNNNIPFLISISFNSSLVSIFKLYYQYKVSLNLFVT